MNNITIVFQIDNAAFVDDFAGEVNAILESVSQQIRQGQREGILRDSNGNKVGSFTISFD